MNIPHDDSSLCQEDRDNCNNPAFYSLLGDPRTARPGFRKEIPTSVHKAGKFWMDNEKNASTYKNRVRAASAKEHLTPYVSYLEDVILKSEYAPAFEKFIADHPTRQLTQTRNGQSTTVHRRSLREIRLNLERMGYKEPMDVIKDICYWVGAMKFQYAVNEDFGYMARMLDKAIQQAETNSELKSLYQICCFRDPFGPPPMIRCDGMCDFLLEGGNVIYQIVARDIDYNLCYKCYRRAPEIISFDLPIRQNSTKTEPATVSKTSLVRKTIPVIPQPEREEIVECFACFARHHKMCVLYDEFNWEAGYTASSPKFIDNFSPSYICRQCVQQLSARPLNYQVFTAKTMQITSLSNFIQRELESYMYQLCQQHSNPSALPPKIQVRELSSRKLFFTATGRMAEEYLKHGKPTEFSYTARSLMLTQDTTMDGRLTSEKALFNVIVHEYDNGWILISYLDSVRLFKPAQFRRKLYQRVLVEYMKYIQTFRTNEFQRIYVWVCPPKPGEEYVFLGRPADQIVLDAKGLQIWYEKIFTQAKQESLVDDFLIIDSTNNPFHSYLDIPYFVDDFWAEKLELVHIEVDAELKAYQDFLDDERNPNGDLRSKRRKKRANPPPVPKPVQERVDEIFEKDLKDAVFVVRLKQIPPLDAARSRFLKPAEKDVDIWNKFMFKRGNYQLSCRQRQFDFSDERRATYATLHMHSRMAEESLEVACCYCEVLITEGVYCYKCENAVFCKNCINTHGNFEEDHGKQFMRPFKVPFVKPATPVDLTFGKILNLVEQEARFLTKFSYEATFPIHRRDRNREVRNLVSTLQHHMQMIGRDDSHDGTTCKMCGFVWLTISRHRRICRGSLCYVPSCGRRLLYDDDGSRFERTDRWNRQFLDFGTQVTEEEIEGAGQQLLSPPQQPQALNEDEQEQEMEEQEVEVEVEIEEQEEEEEFHQQEIEEVNQSPELQNGHISHCNILLVDRDMLEPQPSLPEAASSSAFVIIQNNPTEHDDNSPALDE
ncbi:unnamed protein product [Orchesella dallaii]|uniref:histone acetyltransferase n=1 Tax=Orchesella dallaii TaxID=48710 RepID=A0ABP1RY80_9HEXA